MSVGHASPRFVAQKYGVRLLQTMARRRHVGSLERPCREAGPPSRFVRPREFARAGSIDSKTVPSTQACEGRGYDGGKKIRGRKRNIVVDTEPTSVQLPAKTGVSDLPAKRNRLTG